MTATFSAARLLGLWDRLRTSFWFLPSVMATTAAILSLALVRFDAWLGERTVREAEWLYAFGPEGARAILSAIASSMITVAGLTFSITMLTLQLASSQFGPRLLRNFMRHRGIQIVLGIFISTFIYCLLVLRTVRGVEGASFVPHVSVAFGLVLAVASIAVLIYFIHHVANAIRIETVLADLAAETAETIERLYPQQLGADAPAAPGAVLPAGFESGRLAIPAEAGGYVQRVDDEALMGVATEADLVLRIEARPGRFVYAGAALLSAWPAERLSEDVVARLRGALVIGNDRTPYQDLDFSIRRFVEIAQRALSPGINDPTTAIYCIDRLGEAFLCLAGRQLPSPTRADDAGRLRVLTEVDTLHALAGPAFAAVARYGAEDTDVVRRLTQVIGAVSAAAEPVARRDLERLAAAIRAEVERSCTAVDAVAAQPAASS